MRTLASDLEHKQEVARFINNLKEIREMKEIAKQLEIQGIKLDINVSYFNKDETNSDVVDKINIYKFSREGKYIIEMIDELYHDLNGTYKSINEIKEKILELAVRDAGITEYKIMKYKNCFNGEDKDICVWKCNKCGKYGNHEKELDEIESPQDGNIFIGTSSTCQNCYEDVHSNYCLIEPSLESGSIYKTTGGSIALLEKIGNLTFIPDKMV